MNNDSLTGAQKERQEAEQKKLHEEDIRSEASRGDKFKRNFIICMPSQILQG